MCSSGGSSAGGRRKPEFYADGVADYETMAQAPAFEPRPERVVEGAANPIASR